MELEDKDYPCERISIPGCLYGTLCIGVQFVVFIACESEPPPDENCELNYGILDSRISESDYKTILIQDISEVWERVFLHRPTAIEIFTRQGRSYLFNLLTETAAEQTLGHIKWALRKIGRQDAMRSINPSRNAHLANLVNDWRRKRISNFNYLLELNKFASRSFNNLQQYPVFPWILADYTSSELDLHSPETFRDLSIPIGAMSEEKYNDACKRYAAWQDEMPGFHFGSHYSSSGIVLYYMIRIEPYTTQAIRLQDNHFDVADRLFWSMDAAWSGCLNNGGDFKELVPELFYMPEVLFNRNKYELGTKQSGDAVNDVFLPPWAESPQDFIKKHREALD